MSLKFWTDPISQPCRTIYYILKKHNIDFEETELKVVKDTRTEEFKRDINPEGLVPVIEHDGEKLYESAVIARYLLDVFEGNETLLPRSDLLKRAKVDYWLDWNNTTGRPAFTTAFIKIVFVPKVFGGPEATEDQKKELMGKFYSALDHLEHFLKDRSYLAGDDFTIGDVQVYNEVYQSKVILELEFDKHPNVTAWMERVASDELVKELDQAFHKRVEEAKSG